MARRRRSKRVAKARTKRTPILPKSKSKAWRTKGLAVALDARDWVMAMRDGVEGSGHEGIQELHSTAWEQGLHPGSRMLQPPLEPGGQAGRDAAAGKRPNLRGVTNAPKGLAAGGMATVRFFPARSAGSSPPKFSKAVLSIPRRRPFLNLFIAEEMGEHGVEYLAIDGAVGRGVEGNLKTFVVSILVDRDRG